MRLLLATALAGLSIPALAQPQMPRKSPELEIVEGNGNKKLLSQYRGKVCAIEFLFTTCPHCQQTSQVFEKIYKDLGPQGFQMLGVAINEPVTAPMVNQFAHDFGASYPIGIGKRETALSFLGISVMDNRWVVPQVVIVDRKGMIRAQSKPDGTPDLQNDAYLRPLITSLLKESAAGATSSNSAKKAPVASTKKSGGS
jgi:peroxiredoxin